MSLAVLTETIRSPCGVDLKTEHPTLPLQPGRHTAFTVVVGVDLSPGLLLEKNGKAARRSQWETNKMQMD